MALFQRSVYGEEPNFTSLFRLLDDWDSYSRDVQGTNASGRGVRRQRIFSPRFDVRETETDYQLHGELPGLERENLTIEFTEPQTMAIHGRVERKYSSGSPPAVEDTTAPTAEGETSHHATVSDEETEAAKEAGEVSTVAATEKKVAPKPKERFWHQERSVGEFHRTFTFPGRVDEEGVSATLADGILNITVPKAAKRGARRINVK